MTKKKQSKSILDNIKMSFKSTIEGSMIINILFLIFGIIIYIRTDVFERAVGIVLGIYFIIKGIYSLYEYLSKNNYPIFKFRIIIGITSILIGILTIAEPIKLFEAITFGFGLYLAMCGLVKIFESLKLKKIKYDGWLVMLVTGVLIAVFGILLATGKINMDVVKLSAIFIILSSILEISNIFMIYSKAKTIEKLFK